MRIIKPKSLPTPHTLLMAAIVLAAIATWLLPAGQYNKLTFDGDNSFIIALSTESISLLFIQQTLDSLDIKNFLRKIQHGDIRNTISVG